MGDEPFIPADTLEISDLKTMRVMADPRRHHIVDLLRREAATAKDLATAMGVSPKALYYHLRLLERHHLVRVVDTRLVSGIVEKRYRAAAYLFLYNPESDGGGTRRAHEMVEAISHVFAMTADEMRVGLESGIVDPAGDAPESRLTFAWALVNLSPDQRDELERRLEEILTGPLAGAMPSHDQPVYRYLFLSYPTYPRDRRPTVPEPRPAQGEPR